MNRHYDTAFYRDLVTRIRNMFPDSAITTDIMVGFAGETEEEFLESVNFAKEMGFAKSHIFAYSRRSGTVAYNLKGQISKQEKSNRSKRMIEVTNQTEKEFLEGQIGKTVSVLFETNENGFSEGYTKDYARVKVKTESAHSGEILNVKLISAKNGYCIGEFV